MKELSAGKRRRAQQPTKNGKPTRLTLRQRAKKRKMRNGKCDKFANFEESAFSGATTIFGAEQNRFPPPFRDKAQQLKKKELGIFATVPPSSLPPPPPVQYLPKPSTFSSSHVGKIQHDNAAEWLSLHTFPTNLSSRQFGAGFK